MRWKREWKRILFNGLFGLLNLVVVVLFNSNNTLTFTLLGVIAFIGLLWWRSGITLAVFLFASIFGAIGEMFAIYGGAWTYTYPNFFSVPSWLFILWGSSAAFLYQTGIEFERLGLHRK